MEFWKRSVLGLAMAFSAVSAAAPSAEAGTSAQSRVISRNNRQKEQEIRKLILDKNATAEDVARVNEGTFQGFAAKDLKNLQQARNEVLGKTPGATAEQVMERMREMDMEQVRKNVMTAVADPKADAGRVCDALGSSFIKMENGGNFDCASAAYLGDARDKVLGGQDRAATEAEAVKMMQVMDQQKSWKGAQKVLGATFVGLAGIAAIGALCLRKPRRGSPKL